MDWQTDFGKKVSLYVDQCRLSAKHEGETASGEMIKPFRREANRSWRFPQFYRSVARPIEGIDATLPVSMVAGARDTRRSTQYDSEFGITYDVESAFLELRRKHALELQNFVIAHHKECIEKVSAELVLPKQVCTLHYQLDMLLARHPGAYDLHSTQRFRDQAESFVELVHRDEMAKAQRKLEKKNDTHFHTHNSSAHCLLDHFGACHLNDESRAFDEAICSSVRAWLWDGTSLGGACCLQPTCSPWRDC